ncbi:hypothetical protein MSPP1_002552 [Malassezia sp. CBS 17886]|nr:hypothetical protein MSPP1_002552 [Malassezia sp. CBS 17886]
MTFRSSVLSPVAGVLVAGLLVYTVNEALVDQTRFMLVTMRSRAAALGRAEDYEIATGKRGDPVYASAYQPPPPTYWEEIKGRWNQHHLTNALCWLRHAAPLRDVHLTRADVSTGDAATQGTVLQALRALAPHTKDAVPKRGIFSDVYGDAHTHYLGQGASLR